ncbi:unnamed protein product [Brachionus calyciflorus]|uniref:Beta-galactosidase n=1 Tax=Brachionus calyciflorus TaxID=104777 RepID=A0A813Q0H8_9BILA|nr:unnamed protein product [Brachionus calyciflorus]
MNFYIQLIAAMLISTLVVYIEADRSFYIDYEKNTFVKDSKPFRYISGSIHPYRVPKQLWEDRLKKMWAGGLNAIQIYTFWNEHEPSPGVYDFEGQNNVFEFLEIAQKIGFVVILRPGPYVCAEHDYGGLPWWLLANGTNNIVPRSSEENYMKAVRRYFNVLLPKFVPYLYKNGGPIITVQVENEYGSYYTCDKKYTGELRDMFKKYLGDDVVLFTTDPPRLFGLTCGTVKDVYATVDFGVSISPADAFEKQRKFAVNGPLVNSEFYPGWLDFWGTPHQKVHTNDILKSFNQQLNMSANVNFYMYFGGTNFGFSNGADPPFLAEPTSYDYDAPLSEPGDITNKYLAIRDAISKFQPLPDVPIPANSTKLALGKVQMTYHVSLVEAISELSDRCINTEKPETFEKLGQGYGFIMYKTVLDDPNVDGKTLTIKGIRDRGYVQIGSSFVGTVYRTGLNKIKINLPKNKNTTLYIIVENMGRLNFGNNLLDTKGIVSDVTLDDKQLNSWTTCLTDNFVPYYQKSVNSKFGLVGKYTKEKYLLRNKLKDTSFAGPGVYIAEFESPNRDFDTFLKMDKFTKGVALIHSNGTLTNLGRYWPKTGPQVTLYTPSVFTTSGKNYLVLIEFEGATCKSEADCSTEFIDYPIIDSIPNEIN